MPHSKLLWEINDQASLMMFLQPVLDRSNQQILFASLANTKGTLGHHLAQLTLPDLQKLIPEQATNVHRHIQARVKNDIRLSTPDRIRQLLASDLSEAEFQGVRRRVYETVILGQGRKQEEEEIMDAVAPAAPVQHFQCPSCRHQESFITDTRTGDVICPQCGTVVHESLRHEGQQFRKFEGEVDRNHHGDAANPLLSQSYNLGTSVATTGSSKLETILKNAHAYTELNVAQFGRTDQGRTRVGYKDRQKKDAFLQMAHAGNALDLHEAVVQRAKELFAGFRDDRELVQQFKPVLAACLCEAFEQLAKEGRLDRKETAAVEEPTITSARAARRNELHHAALAGKGGLLLNTVEPTASKVKDEKPTSAWELDDCRSWLLEASSRIAQQWVEKRDKGAKDIPSGGKDELEGKLVEDAIKLCEALEVELKQKQEQSKKKITPRVADMSKLGIQWQHAHERGSGGKGGVGGSGTNKVASSNGRKAGQLLMLKSAKQLAAILGDPLAGEAFHAELRVVLSRQETLKLKRKREEASRQRMQQMKRKPWLQARLARPTDA